MLGVVTPQEEGIAENSQIAPRILGSFGAPLIGDRLDVIDDFPGEQPTMLIPAIIRSPFDVEHDPTRARIAPPRPMPDDSSRVGADDAIFGSRRCRMNGADSGKRTQEMRQQQTVCAQPLSPADRS